MNGKPPRPTYAVLVPADRQWLAAKAREVFRELFPSDEDDDVSYEWEVVAGKDQYSAVRGFDVGDIAWDLAAMLSRQVGGKVYIAHLNEHTRGSYVYEGGNGIGEISEPPKKLASRLGVPFPENEVEQL